MPRHLAVLLVLSVAAFAAPRVGDVSALVARLRDPKLTSLEREQVQTELLAHGEDGAKALQRVVEERFDKAQARVAKGSKRYLADFERAAAKIVESRLSRKAWAEVEGLREQIASLRADPELSKERIHEVGDPTLARLMELFDVTPDEVLATSEDLDEARTELGDDTAWLEEDFELWQRCNEALPERKRSKGLVDPGPLWIGLQESEQWLCLLATPMSKSDRETLDKNRALEPELAEPEEAAGILDLNRLRIRLGLNALAIDVKLCNAARDHSSDMRTLGFFAHESPVEGKKTPGARASRAGTSASAENIAQGQSTGADANRGWWYSPGHHKNMLGSHGRVGLGCSETYWTQMFG